MSRWTVRTESKEGTKILKHFSKLDAALAWIEMYSEYGIHYKIERID